MLGLLGAGLSRLPASVSVAVVGGVSVLSWQQTHIYHDPETLWRDTLAKNPNCAMAYNNLGNLLLKTGRIDEAISDYRKSLGVDSSRPESYDNLGLAHLQNNRLDEAIRCFKKACGLNPFCAEVYADFGKCICFEERAR